MASYSYKLVRDQLPDFITDAIDGYEGDANYNGDQWNAASDYIALLEAEVVAMANAGGIITHERLRAFLAPRVQEARRG